MAVVTLADALPLFAVLRGLEPERAQAVGEALVEAGFGILEVTMNSPDPFASIASLVRSLGDRALIGAGTVTRTEEVDELESLGARLVVSPHCDPALVGHAVGKGMTVLPGVFTPTEMMAALKAGATGIKIFPAEAMPPAGVRAVRAVLPPYVPIFVVGGITAANMADYLQAGATGFGMGGSLFRPGKPLDAIAGDARAIVSAFHAAKARR